MIEIELTQNQITTIDDIDSDLADLNWCAHYAKNTQSYYAYRVSRNGLKQKTQAIHRIILGRMLGRELLRLEQVDHINHDTLDNRRENLRLATHIENGWNRKKNQNNTSGYKGVSWNKRNQIWQAHIQVNRKRIYLGSFNDPESAYQAYCQAANYYHGEFANYG